MKTASRPMQGTSIPPVKAYNTSPQYKPNTESLSNSPPPQIGQGRNSGSEASDYGKYLNDGINQNDWRDPITDSAALNKQAQEMLTQQLKQVSDMNQRAASKKGNEERQTAQMQQSSNERIAQMQTAQPYQKKEPGIPQSSATLQYNANAAERLSKWASKEEQQAARRHDAKTIADQFKQDQRMAMQQRGHENRAAYNDRVNQMMTRASDNANQSKERVHQRQMQESQIQGDLEKSKADSIARLKEIEFQTTSQEKLANKQIQGDIAKTYIGNALSLMGGGNTGGYW